MAGDGICYIHKPTAMIGNEVSDINYESKHQKGGSKAVIQHQHMRKLLRTCLKLLLQHAAQKLQLLPSYQTTVIGKEVFDIN